MENAFDLVKNMQSRPRVLECFLDNQNVASSNPS